MHKMEVDKILSHSAYALPVGGVLILAILVFVFGFKSVAEPTFNKLVSEGKKKKAIKQSKIKKTSSVGSGSASPTPQIAAKKPTTVSSPALPKASPGKSSTKKDSPNKKAAKGEQKVSPIVEVTKAEKKNVDKFVKKEPKPADYDDGEWQSVNKKEKKKRVDGSPNNVSPVASPHHLTKKENEKEKGTKKKVEEVKKASEPVIVNNPIEEKKEETVQSAPLKQVNEKKKSVPGKTTAKVLQDVKEDNGTIEAPKSSLKEKNNNAINSQQLNPKKSQVKDKTPKTLSLVVEESEDPWQENKTAKKKKKARRE